MLGHAIPEKVNKIYPNDYLFDDSNTTYTRNAIACNMRLLLAAFAILLNFVVAQRPPKRIRPKCGVAREDKKELLARIINGHRDGTHDNPWQVALRSFGETKCGASLISRQWVLTAAHCVDDVLEIEVVVGLYKIDGSGEEDYRVKGDAIKIHPGYGKDPKHEWKHDIALLKLPEKVELGEDVQPICLPARKLLDKDLPNTAIATGWGDTSFNGKRPKYLQEVHQHMQKR